MYSVRFGYARQSFSLSTKIINVGPPRPFVLFVSGNAAQTEIIFCILVRCKGTASKYTFNTTVSKILYDFFYKFETNV